MLETASEARQIAIQTMLNSTIGVSTRGCWIWQGKFTPNGYGKIEFKYAGRLRRFTVHTLSFEYYHGPRTPGMVVRHTCDVRPCWNFRHLKEGTHKQNHDDMVSRGRASWQNPLAQKPIIVRKHRMPPMISDPLARQVMENARTRRHA